MSKERDFIHIKRGDDEVLIRFQSSQGETKMTTNNSITVHSIVGNISQNSPTLRNRWRSPKRFCELQRGDQNSFIANGKTR
jgi:hypothetical protein